VKNILLLLAILSISTTLSAQGAGIGRYHFGPGKTKLNITFKDSLTGKTLDSVKVVLGTVCGGETEAAGEISETIKVKKRFKRKLSRRCTSNMVVWRNGYSSKAFSNIGATDKRKNKYVIYLQKKQGVKLIEVKGN